MPDQSAAKRLLKNLASTTVFQASGYILAMINVPYLTRTLGVDNFGVLAFVISVNAYLFLVIDWGFSLGSTRDVAQANGDREIIQRIFWQTITAKCLLSALAILVLLGVTGFDRVPSPIYLLLPGLLNIIGAIVSVDWLVRGMERMGLFTVYSIGGRAVVVVLTLILVHGPQDTWLACTLQGVGCVLSGLAGFIVACRHLNVGRPHFPLRAAAVQIIEYRHYFLTQSSWIAYSTAAPLFLTFVAGSTAVGLFAGADRIARIAMALIEPMSMVLYPRVNALLTHSPESAAGIAGLFLALQLIFASGLTIVFMFGAAPLVALVLGPTFGDAAGVLRWLSALPILGGIAATLPRQFLIPLGWSRAVSRITMVTTVAYLLVLPGLCRLMGAEGAAVALVTTEGVLAISFVALLFVKERPFALASCAAVTKMPYRFMAILAMLRVKAGSG